MCSQRYSESRRGNDQFSTPFSQRVSVPIERSINSFNNTPNEQRVQERIRNNDTSVQWVNDPISGQEKFRVHINIDGFSQNEVNTRVEGNKLIVYGEHIENHNDSTAKKIIEKSFELPRDVNPQSPQVTFPTTTKMQVDFPSRHSNVMIDDGRTSSKFISNYDISQRPTPGVTQQRSSTEYTSTRRLGGGTTNTYERIPSPSRTSTFDRPIGNSDFGRNTINTYSSLTDNRSREYDTSFNRGFTTSTAADSFNQPSNPAYTYRVSRNYSPPRTTFPSSIRGGDFDNVTEKTFTETHRETHHRRSSPTSGVQSSHEVEHHRSGSPSIAKGLDEDRFRSSLSLGGRNLSPAASRNLEVREFSRRIGSGQNDQSNGQFSKSDTSLFARDFNTEAFYRSAFQPEVYTDDRGQKCIEMKLDVNNYQPNEIKVSVNGNDLVVQAEHNTERPPTSSTRAYFYKQITLPSNTDFSSLASQYHPDGKLHITAKLTQEQSSIRYN